MIKRPSICIKYKILKFQSDFLTKAYQYIPNESYLLSKKSNESIRKYKKTSIFTQNIIQINDWRSEIIPQIVHCYFLQLKNIHKEQNKIECQIYLQHMQITLKDMKKLMIQQSFYLIIQAIKAYQELFKKFQKVSINIETIGLNAIGQCIVWINKHLDQIECQEQYVDQGDIAIKHLIQLIIQRNQPKSQIILKKIIDFISKKRVNIDEILTYVINLSKNIKINIPVNLKYLVSQFRIVNEVLIFKNKNINDVKNQSIEKMKEIKSARKRPSYFDNEARRRPSYKQQNIIPSPENKKINTFQLQHHSPKILFSNGEDPKIHSKLQTPFAGLVIKEKLFIDQQNQANNYNYPKRFSYMQNKFDKNSTKCMISVAETKQSNQKTTCNSNFSSIVIPVNDKTKTFSKQKPITNKPIINQYKFSKSLQKLQQTNIVHSKITERAKSFKMQNNGRVSKSHIDNKPIQKQNKHIFQECQQDQSSPQQQTLQKENQLLLLNQFDKLQSKEMNQTENQQKLMSQNNWTANLDSDRFWMQANMNKSVNLQQSHLNRQNNYLQDVKLQRLDLMSKQITYSIIAHQQKC